MESDYESEEQRMHIRQQRLSENFKQINQILKEQNLVGGTEDHFAGEDDEQDEGGEQQPNHLDMLVNDDGMNENRESIIEDGNGSNNVSGHPGLSHNTYTMN